jgi:hypothetical protein
MSTSIESRCASYLDAWSRKDLEGVAAYIHPDVRFKAPMQELFVCRPPIGVSSTAEMVRFQDGLIRDTELFFDARPFEAMQKAMAGKAASPPTAPGAPPSDAPSAAMDRPRHARASVPR